MNLSDALLISQQAAYEVGQAMGEAQLLLARKRQERNERAEGFKSISKLMEAELEHGDAEIEALEKMIFGDLSAIALATAEKKIEAAAPADDQPAEPVKEARFNGTALLNGHDHEAAEG